MYRKFINGGQTNEKLTYFITNMNRRNFQCTGNFIKIKNKLQRIESKVQLSLTNAVLKKIINTYYKV